MKKNLGGEELLKDALLGLGLNNIRVETAHQVGAKDAGKDKTIFVKFCSHKVKQRVLNEARRQKREDIYVYENFSMAIKKEHWKKIKALRQHDKYAVLVYDKIYSRD